MVCQWGMSDLGPLTFGEQDDLIFLGRDLAINKNFSEKTSEMIDIEVKKIIDRNFNRAKELLAKNKHHLIHIAEALLDKEILTAEELDSIIKGKKIARTKKKASTSKAKTEKSKKIRPLKKPDLVNV
jgi:cell division protease FtsH